MKVTIAVVAMLSLASCRLFEEAPKADLGDIQADRRLDYGSVAQSPVGRRMEE